MKNKKEIKKEIIELADEKHKKFHSNLCPGVNNIIGVRVPILRKYAKELLKENTQEELLNEIDNKYYEEIMLQGMIIGLSCKIDINKILKYISDFIPKIDNWAVCDVFCAGLKITNKNKEIMWEYINKYFKSTKEFELRFAIVMILDYYIDEKYINEVLNILNNIKSDKYYVQMATAWAISLCLIKYYNITIKFLKECNINDFTYNKAIQKAIESFRIAEQQKDYLRKIKR